MSRELISIPTLGMHVSNVVFLGSKPEVIRIAASGIVAFVKNPMPEFNCSDEQNVSGNMRINAAIVMASDANMAIPLNTPPAVSSADPIPALISYLNFGKKSSYERVREALRKMRNVINLIWHNQSSVLVVLASWQRKLLGAVSFISP